MQFWTTQFVIYVYNQMAKLCGNRPATNLKSVVLYTEAVNQVQPHIHKSCIFMVSKLLTTRVVHTWPWCILKVHELETSLHVVISTLHGYKSITELPIQTNWNLMVSKSRIFGIYSNSCSSTDLYKGDSDPGLMIVSVSNWLLQALE